MMDNNISIKQPSAMSFSVTPKRLYILGVFLFLVVVVGYIFIKFTTFLFSPEIMLTNLSDETIIVNSPEISIRGRVENTHSLTLNGQGLYIGENGGFEYISRLTDGMNILFFEANNIFGRGRGIVRRVIYIRN
ncbi:MAG: hypothetical protein WAP23_00300 [Candidatus Spechtbacterales bacterium]